MDIEFRKFTDYNRGIMYEILKDGVCQVKCVSSFLHLFPQPSAV